mgnify:CR=1 FL=1
MIVSLILVGDCSSKESLFSKALIDQPFDPECSCLAGLPTEVGWWLQFGDLVEIGFEVECEWPAVAVRDVARR